MRHRYLLEMSEKRSGRKGEAKPQIDIRIDGNHGSELSLRWVLFGGLLMILDLYLFVIGMVIILVFGAGCSARCCAFESARQCRGTGLYSSWVDRNGEAEETCRLLVTDNHFEWHQSLLADGESFGESRGFSWYRRMEGRASCYR